MFCRGFWIQILVLPVRQEVFGSLNCKYSFLLCFIKSCAVTLLLVWDLSKPHSWLCKRHRPHHLYSIAFWRLLREPIKLAFAFPVNFLLETMCHASDNAFACRSCYWSCSVSSASSSLAQTSRWQQSHCSWHVFHCILAWDDFSSDFLPSVSSTCHDC